MPLPSDQIVIDLKYLEERNKYFLSSSEQNAFYGKNVYFTQGLIKDKYVYFQILGNLGAMATDFDFSPQTEFFIISRVLVDKLREGLKDTQLVDLEGKLNAKGKKYTHLQIISADTLLKFVENRCLVINDQVPLNLINRVK